MIFHAGVSEGLPGVSPRSVMYGPRSHVFNGPSAPYEYVFQSVACCPELARGFRESVGGGSLTVVGLSLLVMATHWVSSTFTARGHRDFPRIVWTTHDHVKNQIATHEITASEAVVLNPNTRKSPQRSQKAEGRWSACAHEVDPCQQCPFGQRGARAKHSARQGHLPALGPLYMTLFVMLLWQATVWK